MNKSILIRGILLLTYLSISLPVFAQQTLKKDPNNGRTQVASETTDIITIQKEYSRINQTHLKYQTFKFESPDCVDDGEVTYMMTGWGNIEKIVYTGNIGDGGWTTEFYFSVSGKLEFYFDKLIGGAAAQKMSTTEYRLYVKNDKPIRCMEGEKIVKADDKAKECIRTAYKLFKAYKSRNFSAALCDD
jgi:hypothetical protein